ncbi:MAG: Bifunctional (p)ppGpp synthase/hydrolase RelA [Syntrophorhabdaceae bacterium PtaU1.Bin034]|nr:MAG: Bifunctional (p)ppGpp synthase/hydrolase RelA [Syntrophorhabdaceae bacterium PtaU1.Bin034]
MERNSLELAHGSLFVERIERAFEAPDANLLRKIHAFSRGRAPEHDSTPFQAADLLLDQNADAVTIAGALLAPLFRQNLVEAEEVERHFGPVISETLEELHLPDASHIDGRGDRREDIQRVLAAMDRASRNAVLLIAFRLLTLENEIDCRNEHGRRMAKETIDFYVPVADRLSLGDLRRRLEDASFRLLDPSGYEQLRRETAPVQADDDRCFDILFAGVQRLLKKNGLEGRLQGRTKSLYGIRRKMMRTGKTFGEIMDRIGMRVIVASVPECYTVLGILHSHFRPIPGTFDDYIGLPKDNGYQSLHTCVYPVQEISHKPIEFQIRTELMHAEAEHGAAAHWRYKGEAEQDEQDRSRSIWIKGLARRHEESASTEAFFKLLHRQVFNDHLVVFGNAGRIVRLVENATVQDYLDVANVHVPQGAAVRVNGKIVRKDYRLHDGDSVEIVTDGNLPGRTPEERHLRASFDDIAPIAQTAFKAPHS